MLLAVLLALTMAAPAVTGVVKDSTGGVVSAATVILRSSSGAEQRTVTGPDGSFSFPNAPEGQVTVVVRAGGFAESTQTVSSATALEIVLALPRLGDAVTVTPTRSETSLGIVPASVNVITKEQIASSPAVTADDVLRRLPSFSLFRRTSAISANPTNQGVSLRGIGPSGASRSLVLVDNVPFNDPFGGWVYWTKVPLEDVDRIEVVNGASSSLYGNYAMGGVLNIASRRPQHSTFEVRSQYGSRNSPKVDVFGSHVMGKVGVSFSGGVLDTDGFPQVREAERGPIDTNAWVHAQNGTVKLDYQPVPNVRTFLRVGYFTESRDNAKKTTIGIPLEEANNTISRSMSLGTRVVLPDQSDLQVTVFGESVSYHQNFLAVSAPGGVPRSGGRVTLFQFVATKNVGGMVQWGRGFRNRHYFSAGADGRSVSGESYEDAMDATSTFKLTDRVAGGQQRSAGAFVQDVFTVTDRLTVTGSARVEHWRNFDGHNREFTVSTGLPTATNRTTEPEQDDDAVSPRIAASYGVSSRVRVWGEWAAGFRAPTLNELYRRFTVGAVLTTPDETLRPEILRGAQTGVSVSLPGDIVVRGTWFDNRMESPIGTKVLNGNTNTVQRANLGRTRVWGFQTDVETHLLMESVMVTGSYLYNDAKITENPLDTTLVGKFLQQIPKNRGSIQVAYTNPKFVDASVSLQVIGRQFDDVSNVSTLPFETTPGLPAFAMLDFSLRRVLSQNIDVFMGVQNLTNEEYYVQTGPSTTGAPRLVTGGMRIRFNGR